MTSKQRAYLRSMATSIQPIFQVGKGEISENMTDQISNALEARELMKVKVLENSLYTAREAAEIIAEETGAEVVTVIGNKFVLYRESEKHKKIDLSLV
ncbi:MAG: ribosome assembly RNA-binding protein YhbY [Clostridia bacterium]|nr:ribosome assembly RNA-binding protein YhbY [Clostridia bacterium]